VNGRSSLAALDDLATSDAELGRLAVDEYEGRIFGFSSAGDARAFQRLRKGIALVTAARRVDIAID